MFLLQSKASDFYSINFYTNQIKIVQFNSGLRYVRSLAFVVFILQHVKQVTNTVFIILWHANFSLKFFNKSNMSRQESYFGAFL